MQNVQLATVGGVCALLTAASFVAGIALMAGSGVQVLIPETGTEGREWIAEAWVVAVFAGWLSLLGPASSVIEGLTVIGFLGFFVFMAGMA